MTSSMDRTVRVWDIVTGKLLDWFAVDKAAVSVAFSPAGDFLATAHVDQLGIFLW